MQNKTATKRHSYKIQCRTAQVSHRKHLFQISCRYKSAQPNAGSKPAHSPPRHSRANRKHSLSPFQKLHPWLKYFKECKLRVFSFPCCLSKFGSTRLAKPKPNNHSNLNLPARLLPNSIPKYSFAHHHNVTNPFILPHHAFLESHHIEWLLQKLQHPLLHQNSNLLLHKPKDDNKTSNRAVHQSGQQTNTPLLRIKRFSASFPLGNILFQPAKRGFANPLPTLMLCSLELFSQRTNVPVHCCIAYLPYLPFLFPLYPSLIVSPASQILTLIFPNFHFLLGHPIPSQNTRSFASSFASCPNYPYTFPNDNITQIPFCY